MFVFGAPRGLSCWRSWTHEHFYETKYANPWKTQNGHLEPGNSLIVTFLGWWNRDPFKWLSDLQPGDKKGHAMNHLEISKFQALVFGETKLTNWLKKIMFGGCRLIAPLLYIRDDTLPKFIIAPEKWWLEDYFPIGMAYFQGQCSTSKE